MIFIYYIINGNYSNIRSCREQMWCDRKKNNCSYEIEELNTQFLLKIGPQCNRPVWGTGRLMASVRTRKPSGKPGWIMSGIIKPNLIFSYDQWLAAYQLLPPATVLWRSGKAALARVHSIYTSSSWKGILIWFSLIGRTEKIVKAALHWTVFNLCHYAILKSNS